MTDAMADMSLQESCKDAARHLGVEVHLLVAKANRLEQENAKLRELCADLLKGFDCGWPSDVCGYCERDGMGMPIGGCKLENRARELGVEVEP